MSQIDRLISLNGEYFSLHDVFFLLHDTLCVSRHVKWSLVLRDVGIVYAVAVDFGTREVCLSRLKSRIL